MKEFKLSGVFYGFMAFFGVFGVLALNMGFSMLAENAGTTGGDEGILFPVLFILVSAVMILSTITMIMQVVFYKGKGLKLTEEGICDSFVCLTIFALYFFVPVRFIPWDAVKHITKENGYWNAEVDTSKVVAGGFAKALLKIAGFNFGMSFVKPKVKYEDIAAFKDVEVKESEDEDE